MEPPALPGWSLVPFWMGCGGAAPLAGSPTPRLCPGPGPSETSPIKKSGAALPAAFSLCYTLYFSAGHVAQSQQQPLGFASRAFTGSDKCCLIDAQKPLPFSQPAQGRVGTQNERDLRAQSCCPPSLQLPDRRAFVSPGRFPSIPTEAPR